ncbi:MAG TPA: ABC transporter permease [Acidimicrobiales bacterium]|nr:ABC transporter permease [Acidimicrobiales bacterium]
MIAYVLRRIVFSVIVILVAVSTIFIVVRSLPGNPAQLLLGPDATPAAIARLARQMGLDRGIFVQYGYFLRDVLHLDFGNSSQFGQPALSIVMARVPASLELAGVSMTMVLIVAFVLGPLLAWRPDSRLDQLVSGALMFIQGLPGFWVGVILLLVLVDNLRLLPPGGRSNWESFIMPAITLGFPFACVLARLTRDGFVDVLQSGYVRTARAKGLSEWRVLRKHCLRNMLIPIVTVGGVQLGMLFSGAAIVETIFNWPGIGQSLLNGILNDDYAIVEADIFVFAVGFVAVNFIVDVLYAYIDPRIRLGRS